MIMPLFYYFNRILLQVHQKLWVRKR